MLHRAREPSQGLHVSRRADAHRADQPRDAGRVAVVFDDPLGLLPSAAALVGAEPAPAGRQRAVAPGALPAADAPRLYNQEKGTLPAAWRWWRGNCGRAG